MEKNQAKKKLMVKKGNKGKKRNDVNDGKTLLEMYNIQNYQIILVGQFLILASLSILIANAIYTLSAVKNVMDVPSEIASNPDKGVSFAVSNENSLAQNTVFGLLIFTIIALSILILMHLSIVVYFRSYYNSLLVKLAISFIGFFCAVLSIFILADSASVIDYNYIVTIFPDDPNIPSTIMPATTGELKNSGKVKNMNITAIVFGFLLAVLPWIIQFSLV